MLRLPNLAQCAQLQDIEIAIPTKMSPNAWEEVNMVIWNQVMDMLDLIPDPHTIHLTIGDPKSYIYAHFYYVIRAVDLDWSRLDDIIRRKPSLKSLSIRVGCKEPSVTDLHEAITLKLSARTQKLLRIQA